MIQVYNLVEDVDRGGGLDKSRRCGVAGNQCVQVCVCVVVPKQTQYIIHKRRAPTATTSANSKHCTAHETVVS